MLGRYGNDGLNRFLMIAALVCLFISFFGSNFFYLLALLLLVAVYFRMFSKNLAKRRKENAVYMQYEYKVKQFFFRQKQNLRQRKTHHIYKCPSCSQKIRIPRGKGKIEIRCPKCGCTFVKRS